MAPLILTLVRHGESKDNIAAIWAGHRDAGLTNHGFNQATRLGAAFSDVPITAIYTSDLKRAHSTAKAILDANVATGEKPPFTVTPILREQNFGEAEGEPWDAGKFNSTHLPWDDHRSFRLAPGAESLHDVGTRADVALRHFITPHVLASATEDSSHHVVLVAHGIFLSEMIFALKRAENSQARLLKQGGYTNTGWSRVEIEAMHSAPISSVPSSNGEDDTEPDELFTTPSTPSAPRSSGTTPVPTGAGLPEGLTLPERHEQLPPPLADDHPVPPLRVKVVAINQSAHLDGLQRQGGGIGSAEHDERQRKVKEFFSGSMLKEWEGK